MAKQPTAYTYSAGDMRLINNSLQAVLDAVSLMRLAVDDRVKESFDNLIVQNLNCAITLLKQAPAKPEHIYTSEEIDVAVFEDILAEAEEAEEQEKSGKRSRKGKNSNV